MTPETPDHDLLIEMRTVLQQAVKSIDDLKNGTHAQLLDHESRIRLVESDYLKASAYFTNHASLETKVDAIGRLVWIGLGIAAALSTLLQLLPRFIK